MVPRRESLDLRKALGRAICDRRESAGLSQDEFADQAQLDRTYITGLEHGDRNPSLETLMRVAEALEVQLSTLLISAERAVRLD